jgi:hypothetical protein
MRFFLWKLTVPSLLLVPSLFVVASSYEVSRCGQDFRFGWTRSALTVLARFRSLADNYLYVATTPTS